MNESYRSDRVCESEIIGVDNSVKGEEYGKISKIGMAFVDLVIVIFGVSVITLPYVKL